jgi:glycosyltransferase involved in cell wall biosynthesis
VGQDLDLSRVHFMGHVPYDIFLKILQVSSAHVYLTYPFVLSWSFLEAMAAGCLVVGSATTPVQEVLEDRKNGLLVDFFDRRGLAERIDAVFNHPDRMQALRDAARRTIVEEYDLYSVTLPRHLALIDTLIAGRKPG